MTKLLSLPCMKALIHLFGNKSKRKAIFILIAILTPTYLFLFFHKSESNNHNEQYAGVNDSSNHQFAFSDEIIGFFEENGLDIKNAKNIELYSEVRKNLNKPYGSKGHTGKTLDCSGFVSQTFQVVHNLNLKGSSADIFQETKKIRKNQLKEGDLVFFKINQKDISHVGIYLNNDKFAHASLTHGITINSLSEEYYEKYFFAGGRIQK